MGRLSLWPATTLRGCCASPRRVRERESVRRRGGWRVIRVTGTRRACVMCARRYTTNISNNIIIIGQLHNGAAHTKPTRIPDDGRRWVTTRPSDDETEIRTRRAETAGSSVPSGSAQGLPSGKKKNKRELNRRLFVRLLTIDFFSGHPVSLC